MSQTLYINISLTKYLRPAKIPGGYMKSRVALAKIYM
jgi:hypothetical protein